MTFAGGNACYINMRVWNSNKCPEAYQASTRCKNGGESVQNVHGWVKPFGPMFIAILGPILNLLLKDRDNGTGRVTGLEPDGERVSKQIVLCTLLIRIQGIVDH